MIEPYKLFIVNTHSTLLYFDSNMDLYKADGTIVNGELRDVLLAHPEIIRRIA